jgi:hypothetical protein
VTKGGHRIVAEAEAVGHAGGDGIDILDRAAEFDAGDVVAGIDAEMGQGEEFLKLLGKRGSSGGDDRAGDQVAGDFLGVVGTGEDADRVVREDIAQDLAHALAGVALDALWRRTAAAWTQAGRGRRVFRPPAGSPTVGTAKITSGMPSASRWSVVARTCSGELDIREVFRIAVITVDAVHAVLFDGDEQDRLKFRREQFGKAVPSEPAPRMAAVGNGDS